MAGKQNPNKKIKLKYWIGTILLLVVFGTCVFIVFSNKTEKERQKTEKIRQGIIQQDINKVNLFIAGYKDVDALNDTKAARLHMVYHGNIQKLWEIKNGYCEEYSKDTNGLRNALFIGGIYPCVESRWTEEGVLNDSWLCAFAENIEQVSAGDIYRFTEIECQKAKELAKTYRNWLASDIGGVVIQKPDYGMLKEQIETGWGKADLKKVLNDVELWWYWHDNERNFFAFNNNNVLFFYELTVSQR